MYEFLFNLLIKRDLNKKKKKKIWGGTVAASAKLSSDVLIIDCILSYWASAVANGLDLIRN